MSAGRSYLLLLGERWCWWKFLVLDQQGGRERMTSAAVGLKCWSGVPKKLQQTHSLYFSLREKLRDFPLLVSFAKVKLDEAGMTQAVSLEFWKVCILVLPRLLIWNLANRFSWSTASLCVLSLPNCWYCWCLGRELPIFLLMSSRDTMKPPTVLLSTPVNMGSWLWPNFWRVCLT